MKGHLLAGASVCSLAATLTGCYWLASYEDLTSGNGVSTSDGGPMPDATANANVDGGAGAGPFCPPDAGPLVYCMDFDTADADTLGLGANQASAAIVGGTYVSPPNALFVKLDDVASDGAYGVHFPFQPRTTRLEFQIRATDVNVWVTTLSISLFEEATQTSRTLNVVVSPGDGFQVQEYIQLGDGGIEQNGHTSAPFDGGADPGAWHHVVLSLTVDDANQQYLSGLTVDGQVLEDGQALALPWAQGNASLGVGVTYGGGGGPRFFFDNVRADFGL